MSLPQRLEVLFIGRDLLLDPAPRHRHAVDPHNHSQASPPLPIWRTVRRAIRAIVNAGEFVVFVDRYATRHPLSHREMD
jgi:hypothetical protein